MVDFLQNFRRKKYLFTYYIQQRFFRHYRRITSNSPSNSASIDITFVEVYRLDFAQRRSESEIFCYCPITFEEDFSQTYQTHCKKLLKNTHLVK